MISFDPHTSRTVGVPKTGGILIVGDHASNYVPDELMYHGHSDSPGLPPLRYFIRPHYLDLHIASDIGVKAVAEALLADGTADAAYLATVSRLVVDLNRDPRELDVAPLESDGYLIRERARGSDQTNFEVRLIHHFHNSYHEDLAALIALHRPAMILSLHSFTPVLHLEHDEVRPWHVGILYNQDDRLARVAIPALEYFGLNVGDQLPYSGKDLNHTMNRHAEGNGIPYLGVEMRQDLVADAEGVARMVDWVKVALSACRNELAQIAGAAE